MVGHFVALKFGPLKEYKRVLKWILYYEEANCGVRLY